MKCPYAYELIATDAFCTMENRIDAKELRELLLKATENIDVIAGEIVWAVGRYLDGDHEPLKELAGGE